MGRTFLELRYKEWQKKDYWEDIKDLEPERWEEKDFEKSNEE